LDHKSGARHALLACSRTAILGVDVEEKRPMKDREGIVNQFFSHREQKQWAGLVDDQKDEAFLIAWTRKEAYVKALGLGLSLDLDSFSVSFDENEETLQFADEKQENWRLISFQPTSLHRACVALPDAGLKLTFLQLA